ncbi:MAG: hypothetical protein ACAI44_13565 [Candidatus Sericytochromatia bacterium]
MKQTALKQLLSLCLLLQAAGPALAEPVPASTASPDPANHRARGFGRYSQLLGTTYCPEDRPYFENSPILGYVSGGTTLCGQPAPSQAYWAYAYPYWYAWAQEDLAAVGMGLLRQQVRLHSGDLELQLAYLKPHKAWAGSSLKLAAGVLGKLETYFGKAYPGENPFRIEEDPGLARRGLRGECSRHSMSLASPPFDSSTWTLFHEAIHIWNQPVQARWVSEGMADTVSWLLMHADQVAFSSNETLAVLIGEWQPLMGTDRDLPLLSYYLKSPPRGKGLAFWLMLYQLFGPEFLRRVFIASLDKNNFTPADLAKMLRAESERNPRDLLSGWVLPGRYKVRQAADFGSIKFKLPGGPDKSAP